MAQTAPHWAPNSIPTELGWVDAKTGELLMAIAGLDVSQQPAQPEEDTPAVE
jgi:hypothetical protein